MEYHTLVVDPIKEMLLGVGSFLPTLFMALGILIIGWFVARGITKLFVTFLRAINFDKISDHLGLTDILKRGGVKEKPSTLLGCVAYIVMTVMVIITSVQALGLYVGTDMLDKLFVFIHSVIIGSVMLIVGMLLAQVISSLIFITAKNTDMPVPDALRDITKYSIIFYVGYLYFEQIGFVGLFAGTHHTIFVTGLVFMLALAFGLAGKEVAAKYLDHIKR